mmetsp:Transcript_17483/g.8243  ORF Transcript_17483/g.8243 Transcript_17483/m.8243 type:complete len:119 (-) Transcript_17483:393-749(-)
MIELVESSEIESETFKLLLRRNKFNINSLGLLQIPFGYAPVSMREHHAFIIVSISEELTWKYGIRGIAEKSKTGIDYFYRTRTRKRIDDSMKVQLEGLEDIQDEENFTHEVKVANQDL